MTFETLIQLALQVRMYTFFKNKYGDKSEQMIEKMGLSLEAIAISILLAVIHIILELGYLAIEANATKTSFLNYCIACFNGRFNWVPYIDYLVKSEKSKEAEQELIELDFENIKTNILCVETRVQFHFTNLTVQSFAKTLAVMKT